VTIERAKLSILIPVYNEEEYIVPVLERVMAAPLPDGMERELIVVDDGSSDGTVEAVERALKRWPKEIRFLRHPKNRGKGAAIRTALEAATGEFSIIQDADFEYDPREYGKLLRPLLNGSADVVYGSRFVAAGERRVLYFWHSLANRILTTMANVAADLNLTDMETCYKAFRTALVQSIPLRSDRFGIEPEITIKLAKRQARIYETPISYHGRTYEEGKKIGFKDAVNAFWVILRYWFSSDIYTESGPAILEAFTNAGRFNRWMADTVKPYLGKDVLEMGAGIGNLSRHLAPGRNSYIAADYDDEHLARLRARMSHRPNLRVMRCDLANEDDFRELKESVDSVVCLNVVEHIEDDLLALRNLCSALRTGGRAVVLVPQDQRIFGTLDAALGHFRRYSKEELKGKMEQCGFRVEQIIGFNRVSRPGWFVTGKILKRRTISAKQLWVFDRMVGLWRALDRFFPWKATSIIAIGVKNPVT